MRTQRLPRLITVVVVSSALSFVLGVQAISSVATRAAPQQAVSLISSNGRAQERVAFDIFVEGVSQHGDIYEGANLAEPIARAAMSSDPLVPKAHAIIAIAQSAPETRKAILEYANRLNRRELSLQGLVLQEGLEDGDYHAAITTLDQILRVKPERDSEFFPVLLDAFSRPETLPVFRDLLDGTSPWHERFLLFAVYEPGAQVNIARIRDSIVISNILFDKQLVGGLVSQGEIEVAQQLYYGLQRSEPISNGNSLLSWASDYPPFDWQLTDEADFRAQPSRDGQKLELFVRPGQGGLLARRILPNPRTPSRISLDLDSASRGRTGAIRVQLRCDLNGPVFLDEPLSAGMNTISVRQAPTNCPRIAVAIEARSLRGDPTLRASLSQIQLDPSR